MKVRAVLFDLDGTLVHGDEPIAGAISAVAALRSAGVAVAVVTNNSFRDARAIGAALRRVGFDLHEDQIVTAVDAALLHARRVAPGGRAMVLGGPALRLAMRNAGMQVVETPPADVVCVCTDLDLTFERLGVVVQSVIGGAFFIALNQDRAFVRAGALWPAGGAFVAAVAYAAGREPDIVAGKPSAALLEAAARGLGVAPGDCVMVGDSVETDIAAAAAAGMRSILVLTGTAGSIGAGHDLADEVVTSVGDVPALVGVKEAATCH